MALKDDLIRLATQKVKNFANTISSGVKNYYSQAQQARSATPLRMMAQMASPVIKSTYQNKIAPALRSEFVEKPRAFVQAYNRGGYAEASPLLMSAQPKSIRRFLDEKISPIKLTGNLPFQPAGVNKPISVPVGKVASMSLREPEELDVARKKILAGQPLSEEEKRVSSSYALAQMIDIGGALNVKKGIGNEILEKAKGKIKAKPGELPQIKRTSPPLSPVKGVSATQAQKGVSPTGKVTKISPQVGQTLSGQLKKQPLAQVSPKSVQKTSSGFGKGVYTPAKPSGIPPAPLGKSSKGIVSQKYAGNVNLTKVALTPKEKKVLTTTVNAIKPGLEKIKGKTLSNKEVIEAAKRSDVLTKVTTRDETLAAEAAILRSRQRMVELDKDITELAKKGNTKELKKQMTDLVDSLKVVSGSAADAGRKLQSFSIEAEGESIRQTILKEIGKTEAETSRIVKEAAKVNWEDANSITAFYRKFVKPSAMEVLDEYRYNNMLSNPRTHLRNAFSNLVQTLVTRPATLAFSGKPKEAAKYYSGALKSFPDAVEAFTKSFKGTTAMEKPDIPRMGTNKLPKFMTIPTRAMEAGDKFFSTLIEGGELARGASKKEAAAVAEYSLFRQGLFPKGQGELLNGIDSLTAWTYKAPKAVRWFVPFIRTPMNFAKQWIEYSPGGIATLPGAANKREQLAKALIGSTIAAIGAKFALDGNTTWSAPTDPKEKKIFYASGRKPYSVKIGDRWVSMMYAGPFAQAFALPAAMKYYQDESRTALTDSQLKKMGRVATSMAKFLSGQTFLEGINNFVKFFSGDADYSIGGNLAFTAGQMIPMEGLVRYISTIVDPIYRKGTSFTEGMKKNIPFVSKTLEPYLTPEGEPSKRERINLVAPYDISKDKPEYGTSLQDRTQKLQQNAVLNAEKKKMEEEKTEGRIIGNILPYINENGNASELDLSKLDEIAKLPSTNKYEAAIKEKKQFAKAASILDNEGLSENQKETALSRLGIDPDKAAYYQVANDDTNLKTMFVLDAIQRVVDTGGTINDVYSLLAHQRQQVNGQMIASNAVLDNLVDEGILTKAQATQLKKYKMDGGKLTPVKKSSGTKIKAKKISIKSRRVSPVKLKKSVISKVKTKKFTPIKFKTYKPLKIKPIKKIAINKS